MGSSPFLRTKQCISSAGYSTCLSRKGSQVRVPYTLLKKNIAYALVYSKIIQYICNEIASIVQLVEQLICNQQVVGSSPTGGSNIHQVFTSGSLVCQRLRINPVMGINVHQIRYGCVQKEEIPFHRKIPQSRLLWQLQANTVKSEEQLKY